MIYNFDSSPKVLLSQPPHPRHLPSPPPPPPFPRQISIPTGPSRPCSRPGLPPWYPPRIALPPHGPPLSDPLALVPQPGQVANHPAQILHARLQAALPDINADGGDGQPEDQAQGDTDPVDNRPAHHVQQLEGQQGEQGKQGEGGEIGGTAFAAIGAAAEKDAAEGSLQERVGGVEIGEEIAVEVGLREVEAAAEGSKVSFVRAVVGGVVVQRLREVIYSEKHAFDVSLMAFRVSGLRSS